jgi:hypothetical protein
MSNSIGVLPENQVTVLPDLDPRPVPNSYLELLASYEGFSEKLLKAYRRDPKIFWNSPGFLHFLLCGGARDLGYQSLERLINCALVWVEQENKESYIRYCPRGCGDTCICGRCASCKSRQRAGHALEIFTELVEASEAKGVRLSCKGLELELTIPLWLSNMFANPSNRSCLRQWTDRFFNAGFKAVKKWFKKMGVKGDVSGVVAFHWWKSGAPWKPHLHLHFLLAPVYLLNGVLYPLPRWYQEDDFELLRNAWKKQLEKELGEGIEETLNVRVNYLKHLRKTALEENGRARGSSVQFRLEYMYRPPVGDFAKAIKSYRGNEIFEVEMIPEDGERKDRITALVFYTELKKFIDLVDAFSASRLRPKSFGVEEEVKEKHSKKTVFDELNEKKVRRYRDKLKENAPELYNSVVKKVSRRVGKGKGGLERIRWFGFLSKRSIGKFFGSLGVEKVQVESEWQNTGREFNFVSQDSTGVQLADLRTGEVIFVANRFVALINNVGGRSWVWRFKLSEVLISRRE